MSTNGGGYGGYGGGGSVGGGNLQNALSQLQQGIARGGGRGGAQSDWGQRGYAGRQGRGGGPQDLPSQAPNQFGTQGQAAGWPQQARAGQTGVQRGARQGEPPTGGFKAAKQQTTPQQPQQAAPQQAPTATGLVPAMNQGGSGGQHLPVGQPQGATAEQIAAWRAVTPAAQSSSWGQGWSPEDLRKAENDAALGYAGMQQKNTAAAAAADPTKDPTGYVGAQLNKYISDRYGAQQGTGGIDLNVLKNVTANMGPEAALAKYKQWADQNQGNLYQASARTHGTGDLNYFGQAARRAIPGGYVDQPGRSAYAPPQPAGAAIGTPQRRVAPTGVPNGGFGYDVGPGLQGGPAPVQQVPTGSPFRGPSGYTPTGATLTTGWAPQQGSSAAIGPGNVSTAQAGNWRRPMQEDLGGRTPGPGARQYGNASI